MSGKEIGTWGERGIPEAAKNYYRIFDASVDSSRKVTIVFSEQQVQPKRVLAGVLINYDDNDRRKVVHSQSMTKGRSDRRNLQESLVELGFPRLDDKELKQILKSLDRSQSNQPSRLVNLFNRLDALRRDGFALKNPLRPFH